MKGQQQHDYSEAQIGGRHYQIGGNVATRSVAPGERVGRDVHVTTPHPDPKMRAEGWRMAWIFLPLFLCVAPLIIYALSQ